MTFLEFGRLSYINRERCSRWHPGFPSEEDPAVAWSGGDWANAMQGEAGEAGNVVKKLRRLETAKRGRPTEEDAAELVAKLGAELADTIIYADLLATYYGVDLPAAIIAKFNATSVEYGFPERLS